ncbi:MAG: glycosyltransferase family 4 protein [Armatimonadota bacterium]|nr:MAG: glycosyltransferase family 4 protein [Armatimonadota bacterium]
MLSERRQINRRESGPRGTEVLRVAYVSTYPPRECGLATFCEDLISATMVAGAAGEPMVVAMESEPQRRHYRWPVVSVVEESRESEYEAAADSLNDSRAEVVSVQHEFGIFGGLEGQGLRCFLDLLRKPAVITLHTVIPKPEPHVRGMVRHLAEHSYRMVVMNELAIDVLYADYGIERDRIALIHHGGVPPSLESREDAKARLGLAGRRVLSTFGLVGRGKGLEYVLAALPEIRRRYPEVCYLIVGQTHPGVQRVEKESYREELVRLVGELDVQDSVRFVNRYVCESDIVRYLAATDVYITPYLNPQQVTSGTLAYAVTAGKAIVSTPYSYARFLLREAGGLLVGFRSEGAIAAAVNRVLDEPEMQRTLERRSRIYGERMLWPTVGGEYLSLFGEAMREHRIPAVSQTYVRRQLSLPLKVERERYHGIQRDRPTVVARPLATTD